MDRKIILDEIALLQETLNEQTATLQKYPGTIPQIEIDIILSNIRELYDKYRDIDRLNRPAYEKKEKTSTEVNEELAVEKTYDTPEKPLNPIVSDKTVTEEEVMEFEKTMLVDSMTQYSLLAESPLADEEKEPETESEISQQKKTRQKKSSPDLFSTENTVANKFKEDKKSLNQVLSDSTSDKSIASKMQKNPIKDLKTAIGINEKFMFINELFEGSLQKYNENINTLNSFESKSEAMNFLGTLKSEYSWGEKSDAYLALTELIGRRYL